MKVLSSLKSAKKRNKTCRIVRRKGKVYVISIINIIDIAAVTNSNLFYPLIIPAY